MTKYLCIAGASVLVLPFGWSRRGAGGGDDQHRRSGLLRGKSIRGLSQGHALHRLQDPQEEHPAVHRQLQGKITTQQLLHLYVCHQIEGFTNEKRSGEGRK